MQVMLNLLFTLLHMIGATRLAAWWNRERLMILGYHGITEQDTPEAYGLHISRARFIAHLEHLRQHYHVISLGEYVAARRNGGRLPNYSVALTFDDGYRNFLTVAAPLLRERNLPATVYIIKDKTALAEAKQLKRRRWTPEDDQEWLSWSEAVELQKQGIEFGSHTCSHPKLPEVTLQEAWRELSESRAALLQHFPDTEISFAYPCGQYTLELAEIVQSLEYTCAVTVERDLNRAHTNLFTLQRTLIGNEPIAEFAVHVSGLASLLNKPLSFLPFISMIQKRWPRGGLNQPSRRGLISQSGP